MAIAVVPSGLTCFFTTQASRKSVKVTKLESRCIEPHLLQSLKAMLKKPRRLFFGISMSCLSCYMLLCHAASCHRVTLQHHAQHHTAHYDIHNLLKTSRTHSMNACDIRPAHDILRKRLHTNTERPRVATSHVTKHHGTSYHL